jgi:hypothetical protein
MRRFSPAGAGPALRISELRRFSPLQVTGWPGWGRMGNRKWAATGGAPRAISPSAARNVPNFTNLEGAGTQIPEQDRPWDGEIRRAWPWFPVIGGDIRRGRKGGPESRPVLGKLRAFPGRDCWRTPSGAHPRRISPTCGRSVLASGRWLAMIGQDIEE